MLAELEAQVMVAKEQGTLQSLLQEKESTIQHALRDTALRARLDAYCTAQHLAILFLPEPDQPTPVFSPEITKPCLRLVSILLKRLFEPCSQAELLGLVSLLSGLCVARPVVLSNCLPALVSRYEQALVNTSSSLTSLVHALRCALASIMSSPAAEPYYPLLMDALSKQAKASGISKKRDASVMDPEEPQQHDIVRVDLTVVPLEAVIDMIIGSLQYVDGSVESLAAIVERWRPSSSSTSGGPVVGEQQERQERADPRRRIEEPVVEAAITDTTNLDHNMDTMAMDDLELISHLVVDRLVTKGIPFTTRFHRPGYTSFLGRLLVDLECFGVDLHDNLVDLIAMADNVPLVVQVICDYLSSVYFTNSTHEPYNEKMVKLLVELPCEHLRQVCLELPLLDYDTLVPVLRQHLAPPSDSDTQVDQKTAQLVMTLIGDLRRARPMDEWSLLKELLVESCASRDVWLRTMAVEQAVPLLDIYDARTLLHTDGEDLDGDGPRLDLAMAMTKRYPQLMVDLLDNFQENPYFTSRLYTMLPMVAAAEEGIVKDLQQVYLDTHGRHQDFWCRLLGLKQANGTVVLYGTIVNAFCSTPNLAVLRLLIEKCPKQVITEPTVKPTIIAAVQVMGQDEPLMQRFLEFLVSAVGPECTLFYSLCLSESAMPVCQTALSMTTVFKAHVWLTALTRAIDTGHLGPLAMRSALLALTIYKQSLCQPYLALLSKHLPSLYDSTMFTLLLKQIRVTLPHSLHILQAMPQHLQQDALRADSAVDLRRPVKEYLYGLPPSVRSRYQQLMQLIG